MSDLDRRKEGMEAKFKVESDIRFKAQMHRNKALALWAADKMGYDEAAAEAYVKAVIHADFEETGSEDVVRKIVGDFEAKGVAIDADAVRAELDRCEKAAHDELTA